ncbi:single-stranded DNA-binding protein [Lacticaseibacillus manihotivorans]|uniref:Single-stranded DNA-binding protein n=1 Tax=Lacticaseibacillus manihotivorans TaxID=88233 RepID=A0A5P8JP22_9LACO|nr:single-stranded DNA-binding protein [Lacticaseibacillus manihotivorans]QFQ90987.1 single-stranded DNA-binding protein [Lacticaseibacillus manihotivorans]
MINSVSLTGRLTRDIELKYTQSGIAVGSFIIAVDRQFSGANGQRESDFISCRIWRKSAENLSNFTHKGSLIGVMGHIQTGQYTNQQGQTVYTTDLIVENFALLEPRSTTDYRQQGTQTQQGYQHPPQQQQNGDHQQPPADDPFANNGQPVDISDDDLPF